MLAPLQSQAPGDRPAPNPRATRSVVLARNGLIATSQPLASAAGLQMLQSGGNAIDAAVAAAAVLAVVEPTMTGIGGDLFALVYDGRARTLRALNASGRSPHAASVEALRARGLTDVPDRGILAVTVPGVVDGWAELLAKHGTMSLDRVLAPAIRYARDGFAVSEIIAHQWEVAAPVLARDASAAKVFLPGGRAPRHGDLFANPALGATLAQIASGGRDAFYRGPVAAALAADAKARGGWLVERDFAEHRSDWVEPISTTYRGVEVFEMPPNTQGIVALQMLNLLEGFDVKALGHNTAEYCTCSWRPSASPGQTATRSWAMPTRCRGRPWHGCSRRSTPPSDERRSTPPARPGSMRPLPCGRRPLPQTIGSRDAIGATRCT